MTDFTRTGKRCNLKAMEDVMFDYIAVRIVYYDSGDVENGPSIDWTYRVEVNGIDHPEAMIRWLKSEPNHRNLLVETWDGAFDEEASACDDEYEPLSSLSPAEFIDAHSQVVSWWAD